MAFDARTGSTFAGYRLESVLGRGGMSVVYLAEDVRLGRKVALKFLSPELAGDPAFRERFTHESRAAANLDHPNIVPVYQAGEADGVLYIAMRYVRGPTLAEVLNGGALDPERAVAIVEQVAAGLDAAHRGGVIHRDVKPANVLLETQGEREHAYLSDFGLTKTMTSSGGLTKTGQFLGTVDYVAPEQIQGAAVDGRADVYALGCVLFETLTGRPPFRRDAEVATLVAHLQDPPLLPSATDPALRAFDPVVSKALAKDPAERYATAGELAADARTALRGSAAPGAATVTPQHPRRRLLLMGGAFVAVAAAVVLAFLLFGHGSPGRTATSPSPSASGSSTGPAAEASGLVSVDPGSLQVRLFPSLEVSGLVAAGSGAVWFATHSDVQKFNPAERAVVAHVSEPRVSSLVSTPQGVYGTSTFPFAAVFRIDPATNVPHELTRITRYETDRTCCNPRVAFGEGGVWVINTSGNVMYRFDPTSGKLLGRTHLPGHPTGIAVGEGAVWVAFPGSATAFVNKYSPSDLSHPKQISISGSPEDLTVYEGAVWVTDISDRSIIRIDPAAAVATDTIPLDAAPSAMAAGYGAIWVGESTTGELVRIDVSSITAPKRPIQLGGAPAGVAVGEGAVWVTIQPG